ncbi:MAG: hypothetical protein P4M11_07695 [Candidatus Pacebacteria bacterium]|nr:hypothetical protein [Candidatus Paceibacterota bacterium]
MKLCRAESEDDVNRCFNSVKNVSAILTLNTTAGGAVATLMQVARSRAKAFFFVGNDSTFDGVYFSSSQIPVYTPTM